MKHLDELTLLRMADSELSAERSASTRAHLVECARCQASYEALKGETEILRAALREDEEALPEAYRPQGSLSWFVAAAVVLGALGLSSFWNGFLEPMVRGMNRVGLDSGSLVTTILIRGLLFRGWTNMASTVTQIVLTFSIVVSAAVIAFWTWRRFRAAGIGLSLATLVLALHASHGRAEAAVVELDRETYVLAGGETIENDLIVAAEVVRIEGTLNGDLIVAARLVEVSGAVGGDLLGFARQIEVTGEVRGSVRTASGSLDIDGRVARNVTSAGETIRLRGGGSVGGSFTAACREAVVAAPVERDLLIVAETNELSSRVGGSATLAGERLVIGGSASIGGPLKFHGEEEPQVAEGAQLASPVDYEPFEHDREPSPLRWLTHFVFFWAAAFVMGAAFMLLGPAAAEAITTLHLPSYGKSFLVGLLSVGAGLALAVALVVTLIGIPLGLVTLFSWCLGLYLAQVYAGVYFGRRILGRPADRSGLLVRLAVGLLAIHIGKSIPFVGGLISLVIALWGFGALTLWFLEGLGSKPPAPVAVSSGA
jgi:cytoskeletal protein CcmA (bactofilin family)